MSKLARESKLYSVSWPTINAHILVDILGKLVPLPPITAPMDPVSAGS